MMTFFFCRKQKIPPPEDEGICMMLYFYNVFKLMTSLVLYEIDFPFATRAISENRSASMF